jgi:hypothetical protein
LLIAAATVVTARRMAGALQTPLEPVSLLTTGALTAAAAVVVRLGWLLPRSANRISRVDIAVMAVTSIAAAALCGGVCSPRDTPSNIALLPRVIIVIEESLMWLWFFAKSQRPSFSPVKASLRSPLCGTKTPDPFVSLSAEVTQQLTRSETADGATEVCGRLRLPFAPRQRTGSIHVAFCPPLPVTPELRVEQIEGPEARIKTAQLLPYGARFDLKLAAASEEPTAVLLQFTARTVHEG